MLLLREFFRAKGRQAYGRDLLVVWCGTNDGSHEGHSPGDNLVVLDQLDEIITGLNVLPIFVVYTVLLVILIVIVEQT